MSEDVKDTDRPRLIPLDIQVRKSRYREAKKAGLSVIEARMFAESTMDIGLLRKCVQGNASPEQIRRIVL